MSNYFVVVHKKLGNTAIGPFESYKVAKAYEEFMGSMNEKLDLEIVVGCPDLEGEVNLNSLYPFIGESEVHGD